MKQFDLEESGLRALNQALQEQTDTANQMDWHIKNPKGKHAIAVGLDAPINIKIDGSTGYYLSLIHI